MAKKTTYVCSSCGNEETGWTGRCPSCGEWGTMVEFQVEPKSANRRGATQSTAAGAGSKALRHSAVAKKLRDVDVTISERISTGMGEVDRVLGGGLVRDGVSILTAQPGAGKSTLLLEIAGKLAQAGIRTLYASGEESASQIKSRALRVLEEIPEEVFLLQTNTMEDIEAAVNEIQPQVFFVDSIQTIESHELPSRAGSPTQTVHCTARVVDLCKDPKAPRAAILVGHMTKSAEMAGLRTLEHLVDTVLFLDADGSESLRVLRATKNRFGYTGEIGLFQMEERGMLEVVDPYELFLTHREHPVDGAAVALVLEGNRLIPVEIEALVSRSQAAYPMRIGDSLKRDQLNTLISILEQKAGIVLHDSNVVLKTTGGLRLGEQAADMAILCAIASSALGFSIPSDVCFVAEVGLTGELKRTSQSERRLKELDRMGFQTCYVAQGTKVPELEKMRVRAMRDIRSVIRDLK